MYAFLLVWSGCVVMLILENKVTMFGNARFFYTIFMSDEKVPSIALHNTISAVAVIF